MPDFSHILFVSDYDHTLTDPDSVIPKRNLDAIEYFMAHGGRFTLCTGRSMALFQPLRGVRVNAPVILLNGGLCYDFSAETALFEHYIELDARQMVLDLLQAFPGIIVEIQEPHGHYASRFEHGMSEFYRTSQCPFGTFVPEQTPHRLMKLALYDAFPASDLSPLVHATEEEDRLFETMRQYIQKRYGDAVSAVRPAARILDLQSGQATKGSAARQLAEHLGTTLLVAAGDSENDLSMLDTADLAFVPADAILKNHGYQTVRPCGEGSIADIIQVLSKQF